MNSFQFSMPACFTPPKTNSPNPEIPLKNPSQPNSQSRSQAQGREWSTNSSSSQPLGRYGSQHAMNLGSTASSTSAVAISLFADSEMRTPKSPPFSNGTGSVGSRANAVGNTATQLFTNHNPPPLPFSLGGQLSEEFERLTLTGNRSENGGIAPPSTRCNSPGNNFSDQSGDTKQVHYLPTFQMQVGRGLVQVFEEEMEPLSLDEEELDPLFLPPMQRQAQKQGNSSATAATATSASSSPLILTQQSQRPQQQSRATVRRERSPIQESVVEQEESDQELKGLIELCDAVLRFFSDKQ